MPKYSKSFSQIILIILNSFHVKEERQLRNLTLIRKKSEKRVSKRNWKREIKAEINETVTKNSARDKQTQMLVLLLIKRKQWTR